MIGDICVISNYLAYPMAVYCIASAFYLVRTRNIGTPFKDSLTPKQREIKAASAKQRKNIFYQGLALGVVGCFLFRPFDKC